MFECYVHCRFGFVVTYVSVCLQVLFELARYHAPSTIFLDELESVMSQRGANMG